jgi:hypothetical protein
MTNDELYNVSLVCTAWAALAMEADIWDWDGVECHSQTVVVRRGAWFGSHLRRSGSYTSLLICLPPHPHLSLSFVLVLSLFSLRWLQATLHWRASRSAVVSVCVLSRAAVHRAGCAPRSRAASLCVLDARGDGAAGVAAAHAAGAARAASQRRRRPQCCRRRAPPRASPEKQIDSLHLHYIPVASTSTRTGLQVERQCV